MGEPTSSEVLATPAGFAQGVLGLSLYDWQFKSLSEFERPGDVSICCCNEAGKTTYIAAPIILFVMTCFPGAQVVVTSGGERQVRHQLFPALKRFQSRFPGWQFDDLTIKSRRGSSCVGFATNDPGLFEGFHVGDGGHRDTPLLIIIDEAKTVDESIFQAVDRCRPTWTLLMSSPGGPVGMFYRSQTSHGHLYRKHKVTVRDCPHVDPTVIAKIVEKYGPDHWFTRSTLWAEFTEDPNDGRIMRMADIERCMRGVVAPKTGERRAGCDFAAGGDENSLALADGNRVWIEDAWRDQNTDAAVGRFIRKFIESQLTAEQVTGDADGIGAAMINSMAAQGWPINRLHNNAPAHDSAVYFNRSAELWGEAARKISRGEVIIKEDEILKQQLATRRWKPRADGRLQLESKEEMRKRGVPSPDRADSLVTAMAESGNYRPPGRRIFDVLTELEEMRATEEFAGFDAGG